MTRKRKRSHKQIEAIEGPRKRARLDPGVGPSRVLPYEDASIKHPVLSLYYPQVLTLRNFLLSKLPLSSRSRHRKITSAGIHCESSANVGASEDAEHSQRLEDDTALAKSLDTTFVGQLHVRPPGSDDSRVKGLASFSQKVSSTVGSSAGGGTCSQSEACAISLWFGIIEIHYWRCLVVDTLNRVSTRDCVNDGVRSILKLYES